MPEETIDRVFEAAQGSLEDAAAALWFMKVLQVFASNVATVNFSASLTSPKITMEEMSVSQLMNIAREEGVDVSQCVERREIVSAINSHRDSQK
jgi:signal-transduction protein with cAMP-binding, CBS, and nucleotidyltransferase domain